MERRRDKTENSLSEDVKNYIKELFTQHGHHLSNVSERLTELKEQNEIGHNSIVKKQGELNDILNLHNGRLTTVEKREEFRNGVTTTIKSIWGIIGVLILSSIFGVFSMYINVRELSITIANIQQQINGN